MYNDVIYLLEYDENVNDYSDPITKQKSERQIFVSVKSIGYSEFYQASAVGMKPEIKFEIADYMDYHGEMYLKYAVDGINAEIYDIIRTYRVGNALEIVCQRGIK